MEGDLEAGFTFYGFFRNGRIHFWFNVGGNGLRKITQGFLGDLQPNGRPIIFDSKPEFTLPMLVQTTLTPISSDNFAPVRSLRSISSRRVSDSIFILELCQDGFSDTQIKY